MRETRMWRVLSMLVLFAVLGAACSRVPPGAEIGAGPTPGGTAEPGQGFTTDGSGFEPDATTGGTDDAAATSGTTGAVGSPGDAGGTTGSGDGSTATSGGTTTGSDPTTTGTGDDGQPPKPVAPALPGVDGNTVNVVFHAQQSDCANNPPETGSPSRARIEKGHLVISEYVKFFNKYVLDEFGWEIAYEIVDDGGQFCPERQRAAALKIAKELKPFAALGFSRSAQGPIVADQVTRAGIRHVGGSWPDYRSLRERAPYAWSVNTLPEKGLEMLAGWMDRRVKGTEYPRGGPVGNESVERVYGLVGTDNDLGRYLANVTVQDLRQRGFVVDNVYFVSPDPGVAAQQGTTLASQMRQDGVNTLVWALEATGYFSGVALSNAMAGQNYLPDVLIGTYGVAFIDQVHDRRVWANAKGVSACVIVCLRIEINSDGTPNEDYSGLAENDDAFFKAWEYMGHNDNPQDSFPAASEIWKMLALVSTGVMHSGDALTAQSFSDGLDTARAIGSPNRCTIGRLQGRDYKHSVSFEWDSDHDGGGDLHTTIYWVNQQTPFNTNGYYESYDNYEFIGDMSTLSPEPSHDTGTEGVDIQKQERIGIEPWLSCSEFPNYR